ncbi:hypothetical protein HQ29_04720 [Porphyromonas canoris]|uniref:hypothetical protein n=1 Tax=Porphyromonas canoris TaxID=36875 RepID=UPI00051CE8AE|nr:hypothetical protein [Porphyromonas canoris]KGL52928.1 hypothetical protein HQ29_04720 [Porphyromonas canoris]
MKSIRLLFATLFVAVAALGLSGCGSTSSIHGGRADVAYVVVAAAQNYVGEMVAVEVDGVHVGNIEVLKEKHVGKKKAGIAIKPGRHTLVLRTLSSGRVIKELQIFVSAQSSKTVLLP